MMTMNDIREAVERATGEKYVFVIASATRLGEDFIFG